MTPQLEAVLEISAIGTALLFVALAGLIGLMYLLTAQWLFRPAPAPEEHEPPVAQRVDTRAEEEEERERQQHAVALAVAVACAGTEPTPALATAPASGWGRLHHTRRLSQPKARARMRS
jgi:Na+-transporting methylmalonyl-CoA/oxaloacetate decarboxylase gamma subunit